jgi:hypothetical protein
VPASTHAAISAPAQCTVDWSWLADQPAEEDSGWVRHLRFDAPLIVKMDGKRNAGVILKP